MNPMQNIQDSQHNDQTIQPKRFPFRLNNMLNDAEAHGNDHIVSWMPCGKMFKVHKHKEFANIVMPLYCRHTRYKSFLRQLSMYKFQRINEGPLRGCYHHPNFERDRFDLIDKINRKDRGDDEVSAGCTSSSLVKNVKLNNDVSSISVMQPICVDDTLSCSDTDSTASDENDFEFLKYSVNVSSNLKIPGLARDNRTQGTHAPKMANGHKKLSFKASATFSSVPRTTDAYFDSLRKIGKQTWLFSLREETSIKTQTSVVASRLLEPIDVGSSTSFVCKQTAEVQQPHSMFDVSSHLLPNASSDIVEEIIRTFKKTPKDSTVV